MTYLSRILLTAQEEKEDKWTRLLRKTVHSAMERGDIKALMELADEIDDTQLIAELVVEIGQMARNNSRNFAFYKPFYDKITAKLSDEDILEISYYDEESKDTQLLPLLKTRAGLLKAMELYPDYSFYDHPQLKAMVADPDLDFTEIPKKIRKRVMLYALSQAEDGAVNNKYVLKEVLPLVKELGTSTGIVVELIASLPGEVDRKPYLEHLPYLVEKADTFNNAVVINVLKYLDDDLQKKLLQKITDDDYEYVEERAGTIISNTKDRAWVLEWLWKGPLKNNHKVSWLKEQKDDVVKAFLDSPYWDGFESDDDDDFDWWLGRLPDGKRKAALKDKEFLANNFVLLARSALSPNESYQLAKENGWWDLFFAAGVPATYKLLIADLGATKALNLLYKGGFWGELEYFEFKPEDINVDELLPEIRVKVLCHVGRYQEAYESDPDSYTVDWNKPGSYSFLPISTILRLVPKDQASKIKPLLEEKDVELSIDDFNKLRDLFSNDGDFMVKLLSEIPEEDLEVLLEKTGSGHVNFALASRDPKKLFDYVLRLDTKNDLNNSYYPHLKSLTPRLAKELVKVKKPKDAALAAYVVRNCYTEDMIDSDCAWAYEDMKVPVEERVAYVRKVGEFLTPNQVKNILGQDGAKLLPTFEREDSASKIPHEVMPDEKLELLRLLLPLAKEA